MLEIRNLEKRFSPKTPDEKILFREFDLTVADGEFLTLVGSNGSGKTTLLNIIAGTMRPDAGSVMLSGQEISALPAYRRAEKIARVFQDPSMGTCASMTIFENMSLAAYKGSRYDLHPGLNRKKKEELKEQLRLLDMGLENRMDALAGELSGGQRQALALIMATICTPQLLLLDEHTAALDPKSADVVMQLTNQIITEKGLTAVMVTHNLQYAAKYGTRCVMLHEGKMVSDVCGEEKKHKRAEDYRAEFQTFSKG